MSGRPIASDAYDPDTTSTNIAHLEAADGTLDAPLSDSSLIDQLCQQDRQALGVLYDRYGTLVYTLALRITGNRAVAEAVSMDVFQTCWQSADMFRGSDVAAWLIGTTRQYALRALRLSVVKATASTGMREHTLTESKCVDGHADVPTMRAALSAIPIEQREAIEMAYYDGLSSTTIAVRLGEPLSVVKAYLRRGLQALHMHIRVGPNEQD